MANKIKGSAKGKTLKQELMEIDRQILRLIAKRTKLLSKTVKSRMNKDLSIVDVELEKSLRQVWRERQDELGLSENLMRRIFNMLNNLAYDQIEKKEEQEFRLRPTQAPVRIELFGPKDTYMTRMWVALAAAKGSPIRICPAILNDPLIDLIKALNYVNAKLSWDREGIYSSSDADLNFDQKVIYTGDDPFNLYLLIFLAVKKSSRCKLTGGSTLRVTNLQPLYEILPSIGARAVSLIPGSEGLPLRLESSGQMNNSVFLPEISSPDLALALILLSSVYDTYQRNFEIKWATKWPHVNKLKRVEHILKECDKEIQYGERSLHLLDKNSSIPVSPSIPLDPCLSGYILAIPQILGGRVTLQGSFPAWLSESEFIYSLLAKFGLELEIDPEKIVAKQGLAPKDNVQIDCRDFSCLLPLCIALGVSLQVNTLLQVTRNEDLDYGLELLEKLSIDHRLENDTLYLYPELKEGFSEIRLRTPNSWWTLGIALISLKRQNIILENPGELTGVWPQFWTIFKGLPTPQYYISKKEREKSGQDREQFPKKRRRIVE